MSIAVRCTNILRYDPQQGKYIRCDHQFKVKEEYADQSVRCPKCSQSVIVSQARVQETAGVSASASSPVREKTGKGSGTADAGRTIIDPPPGLPPAGSTSLNSSSPGASPRETADEYPEVLEDDEDEFRLLAPIELPTRELPSVESAPPISARPPASSPSNTPVASPPAPDQHPADEKAPCPGCGKPLMVKSVICPCCGYHKGLNRRVVDFDETDDETKPAGFERWLRKQLSEGDDPDAIRNMLIVAGLVLISVGAVLFLIVGHLVWILVGIAGIAAAGVWLGWWKLDPWLWLLVANRMIGWRQPMPPFPHRKVLDLRNMPIGDDELGALTNLAEFDVIDLEGAPVTDHGLPVLYDYRNLQFLILRDTQTTEDAVGQLQRALPNAWIWR